MWDRLLKLFRDTPVSPEIQNEAPESPVQDVQSSSRGFQLPSTHIGYNYLKGLDGDYEDSSKNIRRFINLNKLLRGDYSGKIETSNAESQRDIRGEDTE